MKIRIVPEGLAAGMTNGAADRASAGGKLRRIQTQLGVVGSQPLEPCSFHRYIPLCDGNEKIQVERLGGLGTDFGYHIT